MSTSHNQPERPSRPCEIPDCDSLIIDDALVCTGCAHTFANSLRALHGGAAGNRNGLDTELELAVSRQSRFGVSTMGRRSATTAVVFDERTSEAIAVTRNTLSTWVRVVHEEVGGRLPTDTLGDMARWLERFSNWIRRSEFGAECVDEVTAAVNLAKRAVDRPIQRIFAGLCLQCGTACYAQTGAERVRCESCGSEHSVNAERERLLRSAGDRLVTAAEAARALRAIGHEVTDAMVRGYARRGHIHPGGVGSAGRPLYRLRDIMDTVFPHPDAAA